MSVTRRPATNAGLLSMALLAARSLAAEAKQPPTVTARPGGFGATASVSVNSGNDSGNMNVSYQENQAIITDAGDVALNQGNASGGGSVQQGAVIESLPATDGNDNAICCPANVSRPASCDRLRICNADNCSGWYVPEACIQWLFCTPQQGS